MIKRGLHAFSAPFLSLSRWFFILSVRSATPSSATPCQPQANLPQTPITPGTLLPADHAILYRQFFYFHASFNDWLATRKQGLQALSATDLDRKAASVFGLSSADHLKLAAITTAVALELRAIDLALTTYCNKRAAHDVPLEPAVLKQFETRRQDAVARGIARLQQTLPPAALTATRAYLNGTFRNGVTVK